MSEALAPVLSETDLDSACWRKLTEHMQARLEKLRIKNESDLDPIATARLRGEARALRNLLALASPTPAIAENEDLPEQG